MITLLKAYAQSRSSKSWSFTLFYVICLLFVLPVQGLLFFINLMSFNFSSAFVNLMICLSILLCWDLSNFILKLEGKKSTTIQDIAKKGVQPVMSAAEKLDEALKKS